MPERAATIFAALKLSQNSKIKAKAVEGFDETRRILVQKAKPEDWKKAIEQKKKEEAEKLSAQRAEIDSKLEQADDRMRQGRFVKPSGNNAFEIYEDILSTQIDWGQDEAVKGLEKIFGAGHYYLKNKRPQKAVDIFSALRQSQAKNIREKATNAYANLADYYIEQAQKYVIMDECLKAKQLLQKAVNISPKNTNLENRIKSLENRTGELSIYSEPWGNVIINGIDINRTSPANQIKLICGTHELTLVNPGEGPYSERKTQVKIRFGKLTELIMIRDKITKLEE